MKSLRDKALHFLVGFILGVLLMVSLFTKLFKPHVITQKVYVPKIEKIVVPQPDTIRQKYIVKTIKVPSIRKWMPFTYSDSLIDISYWAYDSSANLRYEIRGEYFVFPSIEEKTIEKYKDYKLGVNLGILYKYKYTFKPVLGVNIYRLSLYATLEKSPSIFLSVNLFRW